MFKKTAKGYNDGFYKLNSPLASDVHINRPLTNVSIAYVQDDSNFIADQLFPNISVDKQSDVYYIYSRADFNRDEMLQRADGAESSGDGYDLANEPYYAPVFAFHKDITDRQRANSDAPLNPDRDATLFVTRKALIRRERSLVANYMSAGKWTYGLNGVAAAPDTGTTFIQWSDAASTPIETIRAAKRHVLQYTGFEPNTLALGRLAYDSLLDHPDIIDRIKYNSSQANPAIANKNTLAQLFEVSKILVSNAVYNAGAKGATYAASKALENEQFIMGPHALLTYVNPTPSIMMPSSGYTFSWSGWFGASEMGHRIKRFRMENIESDCVEVQMAYVQHQTGADLGFFFNNAVGIGGTTL